MLVYQRVDDLGVPLWLWKPPYLQIWTTPTLHQWLDSCRFQCSKVLQVSSTAVNNSGTHHMSWNFWSRWARPSKNIRFCHAKRGTQQPQNHHFENFEAAAMDGQVLGDKVKELDLGGVTLWPAASTMIIYPRCRRQCSGCNPWIDM